jgi:dethiobiotin synthetase
VTGLLTRGLRAHPRRVWLHKPIACGGWDGASAEDGRALAALAGDGQDPATVCPLQFPEPASPHLAAAAAGAFVSAAALRARLAPLCIGDHDLLLEGAGGLATPLASGREHLAALLRDHLREPGTRRPIGALLLVARAGLGTINHSALTAAFARAHGLALLGVVLNHPEPDHQDHALALRTAAVELALATGAPVLAEIPHDPAPAGPTLQSQADALALAVLARWHTLRGQQPRS